MKLSRWGVFAILVVALVVATFVGRDPGGILQSGHAHAAMPGAQVTLPSAAREGAVD